MKLSFRDLKQQKFTIDAEPTDTIAQVKEKIAAEKGWDAAQQKLIYAGKVLTDANTVEFYKIEEKGFIVCMVNKPKAASASKSGTPSTPAVASTSTPAAPAAPAAPPVNVPAASSEQPSTPTPAQSTTTAPSTAGGGFNDPSAFLLGNRNEATIREMESMGFPRAEIERALRAAFFNPDRAIEYLLSGIPDNVQEQQRQATPAAGAQGTPASPPAAQAAPVEAPTVTGDEPINLFEAAAQAGQQARGTGAGIGGGLGAALGARTGATAPAAGGQQAVNLEFLRNSPHFQQLRQLVQQQPAMLEPFLQQVAEGNPQLAQMISLNPDQFLQLLAEDQEGDGGPLPPGATSITVSQEERDAIERLCGLGFSRDQVIQAYFACDKNEELAANFLFEQPDEEEQ